MHNIITLVFQGYNVLCYMVEKYKDKIFDSSGTNLHVIITTTIEKLLQEYLRLIVDPFYH